MAAIALRRGSGAPPGNSSVEEVLPDVPRESAVPQVEAIPVGAMQIPLWFQLQQKIEEERSRDCLALAHVSDLDNETAKGLLRDKRLRDAWIDQFREVPKAKPKRGRRH
jgi:hypothetical protein